MQESNPRDLLFKGCTRPAMVFGVPLVPFAVVTGVIVLLAIWINLFIAFLLIPLIVVMRLITKSDDQQFRLLGLKILFRLYHANKNGKFWRASAYSPIQFKKRK